MPHYNDDRLLPDSQPSVLKQSQFPHTLTVANHTDKHAAETSKHKVTLLGWHRHYNTPLRHTWGGEVQLLSSCLGTRYRLVVSLTPQPLYPSGWTTGTHQIRLGGPTALLGVLEKTSAGNRTPGHPAFSLFNTEWRLSAPFWTILFVRHNYPATNKHN